jgi:hypothetical protein
MKKEKFELDYTPSIVYTQDRQFGIGKLYINGERIRGLIDIKIDAHTQDANVRFYNMSVERIDTETELVKPEGFENAITDTVVKFEKEENI